MWFVDAVHGCSSKDHGRLGIHRGTTIARVLDLIPSHGVILRRHGTSAGCQKSRASGREWKITTRYVCCWLLSQVRGEAGSVHACCIAKSEEVPDAPNRMRDAKHQLSTCHMSEKMATVSDSHL